MTIMTGQQLNLYEMIGYMQVVVLNHHTELDWLFAWQLADRAGLVSFFLLLFLFEFAFGFCLATGGQGWISELYS